MTTLNKFHWFWAWNDEEEEVWLREMSQKGWHFKSVSGFGNYTFEKGEPTDYVYRLDHFIDPKNQDHYLQLFEDSGWDHMGEMGGWQYFRKEAGKGEDPVIYNDNDSKRKKYGHIMLILVIFLPLFLNIIMIISKAKNIFMQVITLLVFSLFAVYIYAMIKLLQRIIKLKKKI